MTKIKLNGFSNAESAKQMLGVFERKSICESLNLNYIGIHFTRGKKNILFGIDGESNQTCRKPVLIALG